MELEIEYVREIPQVKGGFSLSEQTKKAMGELEELDVGQIIKININKLDLPEEEKNTLSNRYYARYLSAEKRIKAKWFSVHRRRKYDIYIRRTS